MSEAVRHELVAEAAETFGEEAGRELAEMLRVPFEALHPEARP
ncbi:hypothetical protein [Methylobacterium sp. E-046]|nr:hypothetical protein [Methylobacterium sp. E-046]